MSTVLRLTANVVSAHVANNEVSRENLPRLIEDTHGALARADREPEKPVEAKPVVSLKASITIAALICLACGKKQKTLKRHLMTAYDLTPADYRERYGLRSDYPMVAPGYSKERSEMAKRIGLGTKARRRKRKS